MHKNLPLILIVCGVLLILIAFFFGASNTLPYQDPTAEQLALQSSRALMFRVMFFIGVMDCVAGFCLLWVRATKKQRQSETSGSSEF
ncbi:MAG: hypothetical protein AAF404_17435 [Pseudomonadota bacterium]